MADRDAMVLELVRASSEGLNTEALRAAMGLTHSMAIKSIVRLKNAGLVRMSFAAPRCWVDSERFAVIDGMREKRAADRAALNNYARNRRRLKGSDEPAPQWSPPMPMHCASVFNPQAVQLALERM